MTDSNETSGQINLTDSGFGYRQHGGKCPRCGYCPCCGRGGRGGGWYPPIHPTPPYYVGDPPYWYQQTWTNTLSENIT
jgi:hypothetical protein